MKGVYFWGFSLREDGGKPAAKEEMVIYYIGKSENNVIERMMQEFTQLLFGGFGTIINHEYLKKHPFNARLVHHQANLDCNSLNDIVLYKSCGLHVLHDFISNKSEALAKTIDWMKEHLFFAWIETEKKSDNCTLEKDMHKFIRTNVFGAGKIKKLTPKIKLEKTKLFEKIKWGNIEFVKEWFEEVNRNIPGK